MVALTAIPSSLDDLPTALYVTDREGVITWYNRACVDFAGRTPVAHRDRWCVTWKLMTDNGAPLPHDQCPMAAAIKEQRSIRGVTAIAERPDGRRVAFQPYPTPLFDAEGEFTGALNLLVDITAARRRDEFLAHARRCRRLCPHHQRSRDPRGPAAHGRGVRADRRGARASA